MIKNLKLNSLFKTEIFRNKKWNLQIITILLSIIIILGIILFPRIHPNNNQEEKMIFEKKQEIILPEPKKQSPISIEEALLARKSVREFKDEPLTLEEVSQLLWSAQGITVRPDGRKGRTAPSAGALYPLELFLVIRNVKGLNPGVYHFLPKEHKLRKVLVDDIGAELSVAALGQPWVARASINIVVTAVFERTTRKYGERGYRYVYMEAGHVGQNISLQVISLNLGTVMVGAFNDDKVQTLLKLPEDNVPLYIIPVGRPL